jgi:ribosomal protein S18
VDLRKNLKEIVVAISDKDEDERDKMLDYVEKRMEKDEKQIQEALKTANMNAKIIKWLESYLQDKSKISDRWDTNGEV